MKNIFNRSIRVLLSTNALILVATAMMGPIYAIFVKDIGGDLIDASYAYGVFALSAAFATIIAGIYTDKIKENEIIIVLGYIVMGVGFLGYIIVDSVKTLLMIEVVIGLGEAIFSPAFQSLYSKHIDHQKSGKEWGAWEAIKYFTIAAGAISGGLLVETFGFNIIFIVMGSLCFISAFYIYKLPRKVL